MNKQRGKLLPSEAISCAAPLSSEEFSVANLYKGCLKHFFGENLVATYETMDIFEICISTHSNLKTMKAKSILDHQIGNRH